MARELLPDLLEDTVVWLYDRELETGTGVTGYAKAPGVLTLSIGESFPDKLAQLPKLRSAVLNQTYHWVRGYTPEASTAAYETALDSNVLKGAATVFAHQYSGTTPPWSNYTMIPESTLGEWQVNLASMPIHLYAASPAALREWSSRNDDPDLEWSSLRVGTWIVNRHLAKSHKQIVDLRHMPAREIIEDA